MTIEALESLDRQHATRNPRLVRVLVDLGFMRDQGEGIPRMFAEMEALFLPSPSLEATEREFRLTLRNTSTLTARDRAFVASVGSTELGDDEFRALLEAHRNDRIDNARMRTMTGLDTLGASQVLRRLRDRGLLDLHAAGSASFYTLSAALGTVTDRAELDADRGELDADRADPSADRGELRADRGEPTETGSVADVPGPLRRQLEALGKRPRKEKLRRFILRLCEHRDYSAVELAELLGREPGKLLERHLAPMLEDGRLVRTHPDVPTHPDQRYRAKQRSLDADPKADRR